MKLRGQVDLHVTGEPVLRSPNALDKLKRAFGGEPNLRTATVKTSLEAAMVVDAARSALKRVGANNAVSLVIDDVVLFQDREGRDDDLVDLAHAFHSNAAVFGRDFSMLRLAVEHVEAGLHMVLEIQARALHPDDEPAARVVISGRVNAFEPLPGEDAEAYRARVEPLTRNPATYEMHRNQFESFVDRVADALRGVLPEARVEVRAAEALVQRPARVPARNLAQDPALPPTSPHYDPHDNYYPNPFGNVLTAITWGSLLMMAMPPHVTIINERGEELGTADDIGPETDRDALGVDGDADGSPDGDSDGDFGGGGFDDGGGFDGGGFDGGD